MAGGGGDGPGVPIVIDYAHFECGGWCRYALSDLLEPLSGKTRNHFRLVVDAAVAAGVHDILVLSRSEDDYIFKQVLKARKRVPSVRIETFEIPVTALRRQASRLLTLHDRVPSLLAKGFIYITGHNLPLADIETAVQKFHTQRKKCSAISLMLMACKESRMPSLDGSFIAYDKNTLELLAYTGYDRSVIANGINIRQLCVECPRFVNLSESSGMVASDIRVQFDHFIAGPELMANLLYNRDFNDVRGVVQDALSKSVDLNQIRLHIIRHTSTTHGSSIISFRQLLQLYKQDQKSASDAIELRGNRSYWKFHPERNSILHESARVPAEVLVNMRNVILMKDVVIDDTVKHLEDCVVAPETRISADCFKCYISGNLTVGGVDGPAIAFDAKEVANGSGVIEPQIDRWWSENFGYDATIHPLNNDPSRDIEALYDELFDIREEDVRSPRPVEQVVGSDDSVDADFADEVCYLVKHLQAGHASDLLLELRTLRLSENKKDADVIRCIAKYACEQVGSAGPACFSSADRVTQLLEDSELLTLIKGFISDRESCFAFYSGIDDYLRQSKRRDEETVQIFIVMISSIEDILENEEHLPEYLRTKKPLPAYLSSPLVQQYIDWLADSDDESST